MPCEEGHNGLRLWEGQHSSPPRNPPGSRPRNRCPIPRGNCASRKEAARGTKDLKTERKSRMRQAHMNSGESGPAPAVGTDHHCFEGQRAVASEGETAISGKYKGRERSTAARRLLKRGARIRGGGHRGTGRGGGRWATRQLQGRLGKGHCSEHG